MLQPVQQEIWYPGIDSAVEGTTAPEDIIDRLELVDIDYLGWDGLHKLGQLVIADEVAGEIQEIFGKIRDARFPIKSVLPVEHFGWDDHTSIRANNTSAFNYREVLDPKTNKPTGRLSTHSYGKAIDINPIQNPYTKKDGSSRPEGYTYDKTGKVKGTIIEGDAVTRAFDYHGWDWDGRWQEEDGVIDPQHFAK